MTRRPGRTEPYSQSEWHQFWGWSRLLVQTLEIQWRRIEAGSDEAEIRSDVVQWAQAAANLMVLLYRAAGLRTEDRDACHDPDLEALYREIEIALPRLYEFRNFLAHPPFLDDLVPEGHVMFIVSDGIMTTPAEGGTVAVIVDPFLAHHVVHEVGRGLVEEADRRRR